MNPLPCILTVAGSDPSGGAGIQADLKTISMLGAYGASVITALTAQNTTAVTGIHAPDPEFVAEQMHDVVSDLNVNAAKTGMLFSASIIKALAPYFARRTFPLVVDPVCVAQSGGKLLEDDAVEAMVEHVFPHADLLTPNVPEAELFTGMRITSNDEMAQAAEKLLTMGPKAVLVKGGHMDSVTATDWLAQPSHKPLPLIQRRVDTHNNHGTGCTLSAAIATGLGQGLDMGAAVRQAQKYLNLALRASFSLGEGSGPPNHLAPWIKMRSRECLLDELDAIGRKLAALPCVEQLVPESRMNMVCALPYADDTEEMAAFTGGIAASRKGGLVVAGYPAFGVSLRVASALMAARHDAESLHWAVNLRADESVMTALAAIGVSCVAVSSSAGWLDGGPGKGEAEAVKAACALDGTTPAAVLCRGGEGYPAGLWMFAQNADMMLSRLEALTERLRCSESL